MQRVQIPIETDVDNLEIMTNLGINEYVLSLLMHHYFSLRIGITEDQLGIAPDEALRETMQWAKERQLIQSAQIISLQEYGSGKYANPTEPRPDDIQSGD